MLVPRIHADSSDVENASTEATQRPDGWWTLEPRRGAERAEQGVAIEYDVVHMASDLVHVVAENFAQ
jgi:hypothetical protein